ncbi:MAG: S9 family peptidase, partial [Pseudomonadota bacterium]
RDDWGPATDQYLNVVDWNGAFLTIQAMNRDQTAMKYLSSTAQGGWALNDYITVEQPNWINLSGRYRCFSKAEMSIMTREDGGFRHIHVKRDGEDWTPLTSGDWVVDDRVGKDEAETIVYFTGYKDTPLERHLYSVPLAGGEPTRITELGRSWSVAMSPDGKTFVGTSSSPTQPPQTGLYRADGSLIAWIEENALDETHPYFPYLDDHTAPDYGTLEAEDGQTLYYSIQTPPDFDPNKQYPVIIQVYGGPGVQTVDRDWERFDDQYLSRQGYIVFRLDNRGSANRGKAFEDVIYRRTGGPEVRDQLVGVDWLKAQPFVDADRIAIQGWSYGGYMTLMTLLQAPEGTFAAAVSGAPVTDWRLYDTFYTERYMDTPEDNPEGYEASSVFPYIDNLNSPLLLIHGMADDNVTFDNTTRLMAALQEKGKTFELMTYPGQRHGIRGEALRTHLMRTRMAFLERHLKAGAK